MKNFVRTSLTFVIALLLANVSFGEETKAGGWEKSLDMNFNVTQASYSDSWVGGEVGNFTWVSNMNGIFSKQLSRKFKTRNTIKLAFGQTASQDRNGDWSKPVKSTDKIDLESIGLFTIESAIEPFIALQFKAQFLDASIDTNERYINPIILTESAGIAKQLLKKDKDDILTRLGFALNERIDRNAPDPDDTTKFTTITSTDGGLESVTDIKMVLNDKLGYLGKLTLYKALFYSKKDDLKGTPEADDWKAIDIKWENTLTASISKYVQVSLYLELQYDKQISKKGRLKETLSLGVTYKML